MRGCELCVRLQALSQQHALLPCSSSSCLGELGCRLRLDAQGAGECALEVPTSLALVSQQSRVALTTEVVEGPESTRARCEWPKQDLFTVSLALYTVFNACAHDRFWSEDTETCVPCAVANSELVFNVCGPGAYIRGCDAVAHLDSAAVDECQACANADHNAPGSFEWRAGICEW